jgi:glycosyltransferase involved in cell wall biosynthesis
MKKKIVISINSSWNIFNFRIGLIRALIEHDYEVIAVAPLDDYSQRLEELGCKYVPIPMDSNGTHPGRDLLLLIRYFNLLRTLKPHAFLGYTVKPNVYGSLAAHALGIPVINNIAGLGATFISNSYLTHIVRKLYKLALRKSAWVFFQNADDRALFVQAGLAPKKTTALLPGSGIDLQHYPVQVPAPLADRPFRFLLVGRMLRDKGVEEFVAAARIVVERSPNIKFQLLGFVDCTNSNSIGMDRIAAWEKEGLVEYLGKTDDVRPFLMQADCVVLPSYREGVPRSLLEAAAMARPIIATDVAGCRDAVDDKVNGFLCELKNPVDLAQKMIRMYEMTPEQRWAMGSAGRNKIEIEFDEQIVKQKYLVALGTITNVVMPQPAVDELLPEQINT